MRVAVVVPARDAPTLDRCVACLRAQTRPPDELVVQEDERGRGPGATRNLGAARAGAVDAYAFVDADCFAEPGWLAAGLAALGNADLVQGAVLPDGPVGPNDRTVSVERLSPLFESANLLVRREHFERLGGFSDGIADPGKHLAEDVYLGWAAVRAGARVAFAPDAVVRHAVFARSPREARAEQWRARHFPEVVRAVPELRTAFLRHRVFLSTRSRDFDLFLAALLLRQPLLAVPYLRRGPRLSDAITFAALMHGSLRQRTFVA